ncbi:MAG: hypothetical protein DRI69_01900 [Bacteroidetes bacterium]|nr:MAG: hypothetical protein DRI69_01900 [Bacteroidota bacterium]
MDKRLIGSDGSLWAGQFGPNLIAAEILEANRSYKIVAIDETASIFPIGAEVGYLYDAAGAEELAADDICQLFEGDQLCDLQSWSLDFSKAESDVTVMCDNYKVYRASKYDDITGGLEGIMTSGITDRDGRLMNQFVTIVEQAAGEMNIFPKEGYDIYVQLYTDISEAPGETTGYYFLPIVLTGFSASAGGDDAQSFSSPFRAAPSDVGIVYYKIANA